MDTTPTKAMRAEAQRYRDWKAEGRKGGTEVAARRATQILSGSTLSPDTVRTMSAWFARHEVDKQGQGFSPGEDGYPSPGRVAWAAWGGDPGKSWSDKLVSQMDKNGRTEDNEAVERELTADMSAGQAALYETSEHDYKPTQFEAATGDRELDRAEPDDLSSGDFVSWSSSGGTARGRIESVERDGKIDVPDSSFTITGSPEDPAALIRLYREDADGWSATDTLVGHKFSTLSKIARLRMLTPLTPAERALGEKFQRTEATNFQATESRTFEFPFSSEYPVARYFGNEVLSHETSAADLSRLNDGAPLLFNHNPDKVVGVVERAWINDKDKRGYAKVRFSRNAFAKEVLADVQDGILRGISFGYAIDKMEERSGDYVATSWSPHEISVVSIPADPTIGIGRSLLMESSAPELSVQATDSIIENEAPVAPTEVGQQQDQCPAAETASTPVPEMENTPDLEVIRSKAVEAERTRIAAITALGEKHQMHDLARELIDGGRSLDEARAAVLDKLGSTPMDPIRSTDVTTNDVGLSAQETKRFSFVRALNYLANPGDAAARREAEFEIEVGRAAATKYERSSNGIVVPNEVLRRDLTAGIPSAGGNLVADELLSGSFIDLLRNRLALAGAGVTMLTGLQGNISIPRQSSASTAYWVGENVAPNESQQAVDQVNMTPKTVGAFVDYSRRLLLQSSIDVEGMVRNDLTRVIALELDRVGMYGTGSSNQPLGLVNTTGIGSQTISTYGTFDEYIGMETDVATANADAGSLRYIINAAARGALKSTAKSAAAVAAGFVFENGEINGYPAIVSNQLQNNDALFGDFSMMIMGMWSGLDLTVDPYAGATAGTVRIIALQDVDFAVKQPGAFCYGT